MPDAKQKRYSPEWQVVTGDVSWGANRAMTAKPRSGLQHLECRFRNIASRRDVARFNRLAIRASEDWWMDPVEAVVCPVALPHPTALLAAGQMSLPEQEYRFQRSGQSNCRFERRCVPGQFVVLPQGRSSHCLRVLPRALRRQARWRRGFPPASGAFQAVVPACWQCHSDRQPSLAPVAWSLQRLHRTKHCNPAPPACGSAGPLATQPAAQRRVG